jgi:Derlin-2/3
MSQCAAPFVQVNFFGSALTFMMVYVWAKRNPFERMAFLGIMHFSAPWLPWVYLGLTFLMGQSVLIDVMGILAGHVYFFAQDVLPALCKARGWPSVHPLSAPPALRYALGGQEDEAQRQGGAVIQHAPLVH